MSTKVDEAVESLKNSTCGTISATQIVTAEALQELQDKIGKPEAKPPSRYFTGGGQRHWEVPFEKRINGMPMDWTDSGVFFHANDNDGQGGYRDGFSRTAIRKMYLHYYPEEPTTKEDNDKVIKEQLWEINEQGLKLQDGEQRLRNQCAKINGRNNELSDLNRQIEEKTEQLDHLDVVRGQKREDIEVLNRQIEDKTWYLNLIERVIKEEEKKLRRTND